MSSNIGLSFKSWWWIERGDRDSWLSGSLEWVIGSWLVCIGLKGIGYGWNGGSKCGSSEEEFRCSYDIIHQIRIIWMHIQLDNSQHMTNAILERHRETCQEHDIALHFR